MITTYVCEEPCNNITVRDKKLLKIENTEYAITSVTYEEMDYGKGLTWLVVTIRKKEEKT